MKKSNNFPSQYQQDKIIDRILGSKTNGFFLDIGANDGISLSNSYFFENSRKYSGICFEPNPDVFQRLKNNRGCECINAAIAEKTEMVKFTQCSGYIEMLSGISKYREEKHIERTLRDLSSHGGEIHEIEVQAVNLNEILEQRNIRDVDFLSLDIEGGEYDVIKAIDFNNIAIKILAVELAFPEIEEKVRPYLKKHDFLFLCWAGVDGIFINRHYFNLMQPLILALFAQDRLNYLILSIARALGLHKLRKLVVKNS